MKKIIFAVIAALASIYASHAQTPEDNPFSRVQTQMEAMREAASRRDNAAALRHAEAMMVELTQLPDSLVRYNDDLWGDCYYDLACYQSLNGQTDAALLSLYNAYIKGWDNYAHMLVDHDLDPIRSDSRFAAIADKLHELDYNYVLKQSAPYAADSAAASLPKFTYVTGGDARLAELRRVLNLDSVCAGGDELSKIKRLTTFVHNYIHHNGSRPLNCERNALAMVEACGGGKGELNCRGMAILLNECLLSMGIPSRYITCYPKVMIDDCHVINSVWSSQLGRWIWMDPSFNAWVSDENGELLGQREVRQRIIEGKPLVLNEEANHYDGKTYKGWYLDHYMTKNLYCIEAISYNGFGSEDKAYVHERVAAGDNYIILTPSGFKPDGYGRHKSTCDDNVFWAAPDAK
ncbi:MAG: transglutaminase-like domain-containing protein [Muribaculaceae bacterium]